MKRKIVKHGSATLTVSLPAKWVKENDVRKGDELDVLFDKKNIIFSKSEKHKEKKETTINVDNFTYHSLSRYIIMLYKTNFNQITLVYSKPEIYHPKKNKNVNLKSTIKKIVNRLIGAEIIAQSSTKTEIECFVTEEKPNLNKIEKRIYFLLKETTNELLQSIGPNYLEFHKTIYDHHDNITKFINYFLKTLYESDKNEDEKKAAFAFYTLIDHIVDKIRHLSEKINTYSCSAKLKKYLEEIFDIFYKQFELLSKKQISQEFIKKRYDFKRRIDNEKFNIKEYKTLSEITICLDTLNEFSEYIIAKNLDNITND